jgi:hypothetical protein
MSSSNNKSISETILVTEFKTPTNFAAYPPTPDKTEILPLKHSSPSTPRLKTHVQLLPKNINFWLSTQEQ